MPQGPTAFQPNAFQNNAFQVGLFGHDGGYFVFTEAQIRKLKGLKEQYTKVVEAVEEAPVLARTVEAYKEPEAPPLPSVSQINFDALYANELARQKLERALSVALDRIEAIKAEEEEEELILTFLMAAAIS